MNEKVEFFKKLNLNNFSERFRKILAYFLELYSTKHKPYLWRSEIEAFVNLYESNKEKGDFYQLTKFIIHTILDDLNEEIYSGKYSESSIQIVFDFIDKSKDYVKFIDSEHRKGNKIQEEMLIDIPQILLPFWYKRYFLT